MNLAFLLPAALAAFAALAIPLLLHLQRRIRQPLTVQFAAMRWLDTPLRPRRRLRFREPWLLLLRCLLVATVVLALAQPLLLGVTPSTPWQVVSPGLDPQTIDWPDGARTVERRWLAPGFPSIDANMPTAPVDTASLLRELDDTLPDDSALTVYVPPRIGGLDGARIVLGRPVDWRVVEHLDAAAVEAESVAAPRIVLAGAIDHPGRRYLEAAHRAWAAGDEQNAPPLEWLAEGAAPAEGIDAVLWLSPDPVHSDSDSSEPAGKPQPPAALPPALQRWLDAGGTLLAIGVRNSEQDLELWRGQADARLFATRSGRGELRRLDCPLDPYCLPELLEAAFPDLLRSWLLAPPAAPTVATAAQVAPQHVARSHTGPALPLAPWLAIVAVVLFLVERWFANGRRAP